MIQGYRGSSLTRYPLVLFSSSTPDARSLDSVTRVTRQYRGTSLLRNAIPPRITIGP
jgi:hypothetical protein